MTLETLAQALLVLSIPTGLVIEYFQLARWLVGEPAGREPSWSRLIWLIAASVAFLQAGSWVYEVLVPRDPSLVVSRGAYFFLACMSLGFAFYAAREVGHLLRALRSG